MSTLTRRRTTCSRPRCGGGSTDCGHVLVKPWEEVGCTYPLIYTGGQDNASLQRDPVASYKLVDALFCEKVGDIVLSIGGSVPESIQIGGVVHDHPGKALKRTNVPTGLVEYSYLSEFGIMRQNKPDFP